MNKEVINIYLALLSVRRFHGGYDRVTAAHLALAILTKNTVSLKDILEVLRDRRSN